MRRIVEALDGRGELERLEGMTFHDAGFGYDRFGCERESFWAAYLAARALYRYWFRVRSRGHEYVPREGRAILVGNHSGLLPFDGMMLAVDLVTHLTPPRPLRAMVDHFAFGLPYVGLFMQRTGQVPGTARNFADMLRREEVVLVFPEGTPGITKPWRERYRLRKFNVGFVELALEHEAPIVPFAVVGAEEQAPLLFGSRTLGRRFGLPIAPVTPTFPLLGPLGLVPYPSPYDVAYGEPILLHREYPREAARDPEVLQALAARVQERVQGMVDLGLELRRAAAGSRWLRGPPRAPRAEPATATPRAEPARSGTPSP